MTRQKGGDETVNAKVLLNSIVWAGAVIASAVILKDEDAFLPMLIVLLCGAVASDAILAVGSRGDREP